MKVQVSAEAERDLADGIAFYDQHGRSVGEHFRTSLLADLESLTVLGGIHSKRLGYHCMAAKRFPYAIYYTVEGNTVSIIAVLDERRDPQWVQERVRRG